MIRNVDLEKQVPARIILEVLSDYFPRDGYQSYRNEEGFGGHYVDVSNEEVLNVDKAVEDMIERAEADWRTQ